ncbi:acyl-CoA dehydrogenase family protein [Vibrio rhizosphaerae]|uniref:Acyl-CoA dehydrogenase family protein n=1 Tax=Vibrio rhizosphaerae TaxID=398736 RepID=A0ABU4IYU3_9VIBR|nr:acyl-CoA dehydrogenase family protein [Vibrio rhizosphaerae]MDW6093393.1 acyl-CoA dehydrogenase family protein [Vibrio rhizosphaerae]
MCIEQELKLSGLDKHLIKFAQAGLLIETDPDAARQLLCDDVLLAISHIGLPDQYNPYRERLNEMAFDPENFIHYLALVEYISRFDASGMMAMPGTSLSCRAVMAQGNEAQQEFFFSRYMQQPVWTFFAVTEPDFGSDAQGISATLTPEDDYYLLNGEKMFIGGAQLASVGLVFARMGNSQRLVMVEPAAHQETFTVTPLDAYGLAGAGLSRIEMRNLPVRAEQILGLHESGLRQGITAIGTVFEKHRPLVAAMALGTARGLLIALEQANVTGLAHEWRQYHALYQKLLQVGEGYQHGDAKVHLTSQLKRQATRFAEQVALLLPHHLPEQWLTDAALQKRYRDAFAFEYMEGTTNIHRLNAFRSYTASLGAA